MYHSTKNIFQGNLPHWLYWIQYKLPEVFYEATDDLNQELGIQGINRMWSMKKVNYQLKWILVRLHSIKNEGLWLPQEDFTSTVLKYLNTRAQISFLSFRNRNDLKEIITHYKVLNWQQFLHLIHEHFRNQLNTNKFQQLMHNLESS